MLLRRGRWRGVMSVWKGVREVLERWGWVRGHCVVVWCVGGGGELVDGVR